MTTKLFALKIEITGEKFNLQTKAKNFNNFEVISMLREYCDELEKKLIKGKFKNMDLNIEKGD